MHVIGIEERDEAAAVPAVRSPSSSVRQRRPLCLRCLPEFACAPGLLPVIYVSSDENEMSKRGRLDSVVEAPFASKDPRACRTTFPDLPVAKNEGLLHLSIDSFEDISFTAPSNCIRWADK